MQALPLIVAGIVAAALYFFASRAGASSSSDFASSANVPPASSGGNWQPPDAAQPYLVAIDQAEKQYGLPHNLEARQLYQESRFRPEVIDGTVRGAAGEIGIAQLMPGTAAELGVDPTDPYASIDAAARYMRQLYDRFGSWAAALAAYNWGQGNVANKGLDAAPASTVAYYSGILGDIGAA